MRTEIALRELAHGRTGDKGDRLNISVIAKRPEDFQHLVQTVTDDHVARVFAHLGAITVTRYLLPKIAAMNFVLDNALDGGVNSSLRVDRHGKTQSSLLFDSVIPAPEEKRE